jgi:hypothetical protein
MTDSKEYQTWEDMKRRCYKYGNRHYKNYGGRGITMCEKWKNSFESFYEDMGPKPGKEYSIERNEVDGNYEPGNCRWATRFEQARNKRNNIWVEYKGEKKIIKDWGKQFNMHYQTIKKKLERGMTPEQIFGI